MSTGTAEPLVLKERVHVGKDPAPSGSETYDPKRQLWIDEDTGEPLVLQLSGRVTGTRFGETTITETKEGADQSEVATIQASQFGETTMTKTHGEGADQAGETLLGSNFGETTETSTMEGSDQPDIASAGVNAPYTHL